MIVAVAAILAVNAQWVRQQLAIDACLDRGGRFDHESGQCETAEQARLLDVFSLRHDGAEDVDQHLPIEPGTRWVYRRERRERVDGETLTASWIQEIRVTGHRRTAGGTLVLRDGSISALQVRGSSGVDDAELERRRRRIVRRRPAHLFVREGYIWEVPRENADRLDRGSGILRDRAPVLFFPLRVGRIWSDRERERADLQATRRFVRDEGPAPEPYEGYWSVEAKRDTTLASGTTRFIYRLGYRGPSSHTSVSFLVGVGVIRERSVLSDGAVREIGTLVDLSRP